MGIRLMNLVWESSVPVPERLTLLALADIANDYGRDCYPSQRYLMRKAAASESTIRRHLNALKSDGILTWELKGRHHVYTISVRRLQELALPPIEDPRDDTGQIDRCPDEVDTGQSDRCVDVDTGQSDRSTPVNLTGHTGQSDRLSLRDPSVDPSKRVAQALPSQKAAKAAKIHRFDEFWSAYPRKIGKDAARVKWKSAIERKIDPDKIIESARKHADAWAAAGREVQFIPHPATWLHQGRYDDEPEPSHLRAVPAAVLTTYEDFLRAADATTASVLIRARFVPPPQPPNHPQRRIEWDRERAREWIIAHESQIRAALKGRESA